MGYRRGALQPVFCLTRLLNVARKQQKQLPESNSASITIEGDTLAITTTTVGTFRLPTNAVNELVSSLLISGFGPQTPAQFNTILSFREMKTAAVE